MNPAIIEVEDLWQAYRAKRLRAPTIKATLASFGRNRDGRIRRWALRGVSFEVPRGETLGIIGANGSGKSTLLRSLAGIYRPVKGRVTVRGRASSLIDLTAGFSIDLSALDNVLVAGAIYGIPRKVLLARFDEIMSFAGLEGESESPLRAFSTGMAMRLGFSLAVSLEPDILLVDEVLAVGDESFKVQCLQKVQSMRAAGTTVVFVSHELSMVRSLADRAIVLDKGEIQFVGDSEDAIQLYCERLGVSPEAAIARTSLEPSSLHRIERAWARRK
jgi:ABC-2 type transport system ATP-binding protein